MEYGIVRLSAIPGRAEPSERAEMVTQLLLGETYSVLQKKGQWLQVKVQTDGYECWFHEYQHNPISEEDFNAHSSSNSRQVIDRIASIIDKSTGETHYAPFASFIRETERWDFHSKLTSPDNQFSTEDLERFARIFLNTPYFWGGKTPHGIDCSGLVQVIYSVMGVRLPRDASQQAEVGESVDISDVKRGDLAYFGDDGKGITHVGICLEGSTILHASGQVRIDTLDEKGIYNEGRKAYSHKLRHIRRVL